MEEDALFDKVEEATALAVMNDDNARYNEHGVDAEGHEIPGRVDDNAEVVNLAWDGHWATAVTKADNKHASRSNLKAGMAKPSKNSEEKSDAMQHSGVGSAVYNSDTVQERRLAKKR